MRVFSGFGGLGELCAVRADARSAGELRAGCGGGTSHRGGRGRGVSPRRHQGTKGRGEAPGGTGRRGQGLGAAAQPGVGGKLAGVVVWEGRAVVGLEGTFRACGSAAEATGGVGVPSGGGRGRYRNLGPLGPFTILVARGAGRARTRAS